MWSTFSYHLVIEEAVGASFGSQQTVMKIIETNQFKHLCHLCLFISMGTDAEIKKHLAVELKLLKVQIFTVFKNITRMFCTMRDIPSRTVFFTASIASFSGMASKFFFTPFVTLSVAPVITSIIIHVMYHIHCVSVHKSLYFSFFYASCCMKCQSADVIIWTNYTAACFLILLLCLRQLGTYYIFHSVFLHIIIIIIIIIMEFCNVCWHQKVECMRQKFVALWQYRCFTNDQLQGLS